MAGTSEEEKESTEGGNEERNASIETEELSHDFTVGEILRDPITQEPKWIVADFGERLQGHGQSLSREKYPILYTAIDNQYGEGDTVLEFKLPDFRTAVEDRSSWGPSLMTTPSLDIDVPHPMNGMNQDIGKLMERIGRLERLAILEHEYDPINSPSYIHSKVGSIIRQLISEQE